MKVYIMEASNQHDLWVGGKGVPNWRKKEEILAAMRGETQLNWQSAVVLIDAQAHRNLLRAYTAPANSAVDDRKEDAA